MLEKRQRSLIAEGLLSAVHITLLEATMESLTIDIGQDAVAMELVVQELALVAQPARGSVSEVAEVKNEFDRLLLLGCLVAQMPAATYLVFLSMPKKLVAPSCPLPTNLSRSYASCA